MQTNEFPDVEFEEEGAQRRAAQQRKGTFVRFELRPKRNSAKSDLEGRPVFDEVEYIEIVTPGDKYNIPHRPVRNHDKRVWSQEYAAWKNSQHQDAVSGTPLSQWPLVSRAQVEELAYHKVRTVEQLAAVSDSNASALGPSNARLIKRAQDWLEQAATGAALSRQRAEVEKRDSEIATLKAQMDSLMKMVEAQTTPSAPAPDVPATPKTPKGK